MDRPWSAEFGMRPVLFKLFGYSVDSYAALMILGYLAALGVILVAAKGRNDKIDRPQAWDLYIVMVISSVLGAKFGHVFFEASAHKREDGTPIEGVIDLLRWDWMHPLRIGEAGYVWYGGMIGALLIAVIYFKRRPHLNAWVYADCFAPAIMVGAAVGRTGCFLAGCCYGVATDAPWGVQFPGQVHPVHPTQLYDALVAITLGGLLLWRFARRRFDGENIAFLLMSYPPLRATTEIFRGDPERGAFGPLSTSQGLSIPLFLIGLALYVHLSKQPKDKAPPISADGAETA